MKTENKQGSGTNVEHSTDDGKPLVSGSLSKREKLSLLSADIFARRNDLNFHLKSELCAVIWLLAKGTKNEFDCKEIINSVYPTFFKDCHERAECCRSGGNQSDEAEQSTH